MIKLVTYSTNRFEKLSYYAGTDLIKQHLLDNGHKTSVDNVTINLYPPTFEKEFKNKIVTINSFDKTIPEIYQLEPIIQLIQNYRNNEDDLLKDIDHYFTELEMVDNRDLVIFAKNFKVSDGDIIGQQVLYLFFFHCLLFLLQVKKENPNKKLISVFGGYHITLSKVVRDFLIKFDFVDYLVIDDGRQPLLDIANGNAFTKEINGIFLDSVHHCEYTKLERRLRPGNSIQTISSIGCPNNCRFCASARKHILYDLDELKEYLATQNKIYPINYISLVDDLINPTLQRSKDLCRMLIDLKNNHHMNFEWEGHFFAKYIDEESVDLLKESNCKKLFIGTETFDDEVLKIINKKTTSAEYLAAIKMLNDKDIETKLGIIVNLPGETKERFMNSVKILEQIDNKNTIIVPTIFKLFPNSEIYILKEKYGIKITDWESEITDRLPETKGMSIPKEFEYIEEYEMTSREKYDFMINHFNLGDNRVDKSYSNDRYTSQL